MTISWQIHNIDAPPQHVIFDFFQMVHHPLHLRTPTQEAAQGAVGGQDLPRVVCLGTCLAVDQTTDTTTIIIITTQAGDGAMGAGGVDGVTEAGGMVGVQAGVEIEGTAQGGAALVGEEEEEDLGVDKHQGQVAAAAAPEHARLQVSMQEFW